jgi:streptogramin lyase
MPFSARLGFQYANAPAVGPILPDYPGIPTSTQYTNYLANLSGTAATTISTNQSPNVNIGGYSIVADATGNLHIPCRTTSKGNFTKIDPSTNTVSETITTGFSTNQFQGATLGNNTLIYLAPIGNSSVGEFDPINETLTILPITGGPGGTTGFFGALTLPDGDILCLPQENHALMRFTPGNNAAVLVGEAAGQRNGRGGFCLAPNGNVYVFPQANNHVCKYDPVANSWSSLGTASSKYRGGAVDNTGNILVSPDNTSNILEINTTNDTFSERTFTGVSINSSQGTPNCYGATSMPNGNVLLCGYKSNEHYEINASGNVGSEHTSTISSRPTFLGAAYGKNDKVYGITAAMGTSPNGRMDIFDTNANTDISSANIQMTFASTPVGGGSL